MSGPTPEVEKTLVENRPAEPASSRAQTCRARRLLIVFSVLLGLWIAAMVAMYAKTVYPERYPTTAPATSIRK